jgi:osmotically-inducible protein OsmY
MSKKPSQPLVLITSLGAWAMMVVLAGCASDPYDQNTSRQIEDSRTAERAREALAAGADYKYDGVKVMASNGVVRLSGFVNTSAQRRRAAEISRQVAGVKGVENDLTLKN